MTIILSIGFITLLIVYFIQYKTIKKMEEKVHNFDEYAGGSVESENYYKDYDDRMAQLREELGMEAGEPTDETKILNPMLFNIPDDEIIEVKKFKKEVVE